MPNFERVIPVLTYQDIPAAHDFLVQAFGVHRTLDGQAVHGEEGHRWWFAEPVMRTRTAGR